ncbi:MAG: histone deacetylase [Planctomycetales bacterium]|nr:histone deacetylase [Planctomycetales bacterium]
MLLYLDDAFAEHETGAHPECPQRILGLNQLLRNSGWLERAVLPHWTSATPEQLMAVHDAAYITDLQHWCEQAVGRIESDTVISHGSWKAALLAAGAAVDATERVMRGQQQTAFCAIRPPGHHAKPSGAMGFCLFNNVAIAAHAALSAGAHRIMIVDWDVHHGNGTQDVFYADGRVGFFSIHRSPFYPGTGSKNETGAGAGLGYISNAPVPAETNLREFVQTFEKGLTALADKTKPELILLSAGFDAHQADPVGSLCLQDEDFAELTRIVKQVAEVHCEGRIVSLLEGGYHLDHMPRSALEHVKALAE